jgi:hypothetical protein
MLSKVKRVWTTRVFNQGITCCAQCSRSTRQRNLNAYAPRARIRNVKRTSSMWPMLSKALLLYHIQATRDQIQTHTHRLTLERNRPTTIVQALLAQTPSTVEKITELMPPISQSSKKMARLPARMSLYRTTDTSRVDLLAVMKMAICPKAIPTPIISSEALTWLCLRRSSRHLQIMLMADSITNNLSSTQP